MTDVAPTLITVVLHWAYLAYRPTMFLVLVVQAVTKRKDQP
jgi:hypothetical protein